MRDYDVVYLNDWESMPGAQEVREMISALSVFGSGSISYYET